METHATADLVTKSQLEQVFEGGVKRKLAEPFEDAIREFHRASHYEGTVRQWLTYPVEARQQQVAVSFDFIPQQDGEKDSDFQSRQRERWRSLCVIIQEESRAALGIDADPANSSAEVAIAALKKLFPNHWKRGG
jgi:hypothetical protein